VEHVGNTVLYMVKPSFARSVFGRLKDAFVSVGDGVNVI
jgi:hypothetical protein